MSDPAQVLREFTPSKEFFVGIDSMAACLIPW